MSIRLHVVWVSSHTLLNECDCPRAFTSHLYLPGGKLTFPFLVDPNTGTKLYESADIVRYLYDRYGNGAPFPERIVSTTALTGWMPTLLRAGRGMTRYEGSTRVAGGEEDIVPLTLYNYEGNQFARLVRGRCARYTLLTTGKTATARIPDRGNHRTVRPRR